MFESIIYKNAVGTGPLIDIGALAEGLIFYGRVAIIGNTATLKDILGRIPPFILLSLLRDGRIEFHYLSDQTGVSSMPTDSGRLRHGLVRFSSPNHTIEKIGMQAFKDAAGSSGSARVGASQFTRLLQPLDHSGFNQRAILDALSDNISTEATVESLIRIAAPEYTHREVLRFRIEQQHNDLFIDTNIDFNKLNESYHNYVPAKHSTLSEAHILSLLQDAYESTYFAGKLNSEIAVSPIERVIQASSVESIVRRHSQSETQIGQFINLTLADAHAIREAVNSGAVPFAAVVKLLDSADKFRHWLREQPADAELLRAYYQETIKDTWAEKLPTKSARWSIFTGIGLGIDALGAGGLGTAAGLAISATDTFLIDKLIQGWKPHQFIEGELRPLFGRESK
ncbi:MAG: hypothetical protein LUQ45_04155 [Methanoregulaceae archaeon]|nr:hypothetical protein [Methanoregulaceae archaeon]